MTPNPRQTKLLDEVRARGAVSVERLAERLGVTLQTVRRDVQRLAESGLVARFHGGVSVPSKASSADAWRQRQNIRAEAKMRIAQTVVAAIPDGSSLMLGVGTTVEAVARELSVRRRLHVVTHSLHVANILSEHPDCRIHLAGGLVRTRDRGIEGELALDFMRQFKVDFGLISAVGLDADGSLRDQDYRDQKMLHAVIEQSREAWLLVDVSKFHRPAMIEIGRLEQVDRVFTDTPPPPPFAELLAQIKVGLTVAADMTTEPAAAPHQHATKTRQP